MPLASCIYCSVLFDPGKGEGDHVIAAALGEFRKDTRFRGACPTCNQRIGKSEQVLLHCGPDAFFRRVVNPALPSSRRRGRSPVKAAMGVPGLSHTVDCDDHRMLVRPSADDPQRVVGVDQLVIQDSKGDEYRFRLFPNMNADALKQDILNTIAPPPIPKLWLHCDLRRDDEYQSLLHRMFPSGQKHRLPETPIGNRAVNGQVHFTVNQHYWRSLAKIGFHYYLCHTRRGVRGDEPGFASIRDFIINGGDKSKFFRKPKDLIALPFGDLPEGGILTPTQWCHILGANETSNEVFAYVHLFVGPACIPTPHYVALGTLGTEIVGLNSFIHGHVYLYDEQQNQSGTAGMVEAATVTMYREDSVPASVFVQ